MRDPVVGARLRRILIALLLLAGLAGGLEGLKPLFMSRACVTEMQKVVRLPGVTIEMEEVSCDVLAKDEEVFVYAKRPLPADSWFWTRWGDRRELLFSYDPGAYDDRLPTVARASRSTLLISVAKASSINVQRPVWDGLRIVYRIGQVEFPQARGGDRR